MVHAVGGAVGSVLLAVARAALSTNEVRFASSEWYLEGVRLATGKALYRRVFDFWLQGVDAATPGDATPARPLAVAMQGERK
jgi:hypothetical protein